MPGLINDLRSFLVEEQTIINEGKLMLCNEHCPMRNDNNNIAKSTK